MIFRPRVVLTLLAALFILALPATASAAVFTVDSTGDGADKASDGVCETSVAGECTLRAAIQESNNSAAAKDTILFDLSVFEGQIADTIAPATVLPPLTSPVEINAGTCLTAAGVNGPCAGINGPSGEVGLEVTADGSSISGLSLTGLSFAILIGSSSSNVTLRGNWIGVKLDGTAGQNSNFGIFVDPNSDGATIGGTEVVQRNVIANTTGTGLDLEGASEATIEGNYFGVGVDGETEMSNGKNIEITGRKGLSPSEDVEAEDDEVGATVEGATLTSAACDGGCNVIAGAEGTGIDLNGSAIQSEKPAIGALVHGNYVGLDATGTDTIANAGIGIWVGGADHVIVGGSTTGDGNFVVGGSEGIVSESGGEDFKAIGNWIGFGADGSDQAAPAEKGILALALSVSEESEIDSNEIRMVGGVGIETRFLTGRIIDNKVEGGNLGIRTVVGSGAGLIASNEVEAPGEAGILVENPDNDIRGNSVFSSGGAGIKVRNPPGTAMTGNTVGGSNEDGENVLESNSGPAIVVLEEALEPGSQTQITRNRGSLNGGPFISLLNGANEGIATPVVTAVTATSATGTADPGALVRVFRKTESDPGELAGFLGETIADGSGNWKAALPAVGAGTLVTATQTVNSATSQLASPLAVPAEPSGGGGGGGASNGGGNPPDTTPPTVKITKAPKAKSASTTAKFKFKANEAGSTFQCKFDKGKFKICRSPKTYKKLKPGKHVFRVRATDKAGNVSKPATRKFKVLG